VPKFTVTHELRCSVDTFWRLFFDAPFNDALYLGHLGFPQFKVVEQRDAETRITRKVVGQPKMSVPAPVAKLLGQNFGYTEDGTFEKATKVWTYKITPSALAGKMRNEGTLRVEAIGEGKVRRVADLLVECSVFGLGGLIESSTEKQLRDGWDASAAFTNRYVETEAR
jgi:hypothetical protein